MNKKYLEDNILYVEDFISEEVANNVLSSDIDWSKDRVNDIHNNILQGRFANVEEENYFIENVAKQVSLLVNNDSQKFRIVPLLTKYEPKPENCECDKCKNVDGHALSWHYENHPECDFESRWITLGIVLYFNDDYDGGELIFKHKPVTIKPKKNSLMVFPGSEEYTHAVTAVTGKERIVFSAFVYSTDYWDILKRSGLIPPDIIKDKNL